MTGILTAILADDAGPVPHGTTLTRTMGLPPGPVKVHLRLTHEGEAMLNAGDVEVPADFLDATTGEWWIIDRPDDDVDLIARPGKIPAVPAGPHPYRSEVPESRHARWRLPLADGAPFPPGVDGVPGHPSHVYLYLDEVPDRVLSEADGIGSYDVIDDLSTSTWRVAWWPAGWPDDYLTGGPVCYEATPLHWKQQPTSFRTLDGDQLAGKVHMTDTATGQKATIDLVVTDALDPSAAGLIGSFEGPRPAPDPEACAREAARLLDLAEPDVRDSKIANRIGEQTYNPAERQRMIDAAAAWAALANRPERSVIS